MKAVKFSPIYGNNIGDIAISRSIEYLFSKENIGIKSNDILFREPLSYNKNSLEKGSRIAVSTILQLHFPKFFSILKKIIFYFKRSTLKFSHLIKEADFVIFGGGNLLMSKMGSDYGFRIAKFAQNSPVPVIVFSCGAGPFLVDEKFICKTILDYSSYISVRDELSVSYLNKFSGRVTPQVTIDPAFVISDIYPRKNVGKNKVLGINVISNFFSDNELKEFAQRTFEFALANNLSVRIINTAFPSDDEEARKFVKCLQDISNEQIEIEVTSLTTDLSNLAKCYEDLKIFIGCRMHSLIFALSYNIPSLGFCWDNKVKSMMARFLGSEFREEFIVTSKSNFTIIYNNLLHVNYPYHLNRAKKIIQNDVRSAIVAVNKTRDE